MHNLPAPTFQVAFFIALAALVATKGIPVLVALYLVTAVISAVVYNYIRAKLRLVAQLMKVASDSLAANPVLVLFALTANLAAILPLAALGTAIYFLHGNGVRRVTPRPTRNSALVA